MPKRTPIQYLGLVARGFCMGCADVVPGVSGGTMAFILGIYEELIESIRKIGRSDFLKPLFRLRIVEALEAINFWFLISILGGIGIAVLSFAKGIEWMLDHQPVIIWSFFFGLVLASVIVVAQRCRKWTPTLWLALIGGTVGAYYLVGLVPVQTPEEWWFLIVSGAIAICAMILPGISGAFILVLLGKYQYILSAVNERYLPPLIWLGLGALIGIVSFAQVLGWLFRKYHDPTVALLTGLMLGSLRKVWPWKEDIAWIIDRHGVKLPTIQQNVWPGFLVNGGVNLEVVSAVVMALVGLIVVIVIENLANRGTRTTAGA